MSKKNKNHKTAMIIAFSFAIAVTAKSSSEEKTAQREWTEEYVRTLLIQNAGHYLYPGDKDREEYWRLLRSVDQVYPYLIKMLDEEHRNSFVVPTVFSMLSRTTNNHELFVGVISNKLEKTMRDSDVAVRALERIGGENAARVLIGLLDDEKEANRRSVIKALATIGTDSAYEAISKFASRPRDEETTKYHYDWPEALVALERHTGENKATGVLVGRLDDPSNHYRFMVIKWLESTQTDRAYEAISEFTLRSRDEDATTRDAPILKEARAALERRDAWKENATTTTNTVPEKSTTP